MKKISDLKRSDDVLSKILKALPREAASPGFLAKTLRASRQPPRTFPRGILAIATILLMALTIAWSWKKQPLTPSGQLLVDHDKSLELGADLAELAKMTRELERIQTVSQSKLPVLRVSDDQKKDFFIDLHSFAAMTSEITYARYRPTRSF